ncbi:MAG: GHMP kinase [Verrucomicrobiae bacterium]
MIISKTPLRISLGGGGSDLPSFYKNEEFGAVLSTAINKYIYVIVKSHSEIFDERIRLNYSEVEKVQSTDEIRNPIMRESLKFLEIDDRLFINTIADLPGSSGLGSSSCFCVGLLNALYKYKGEAVSTGRLAEEAAHIEIDVLGRPMGKQDHYSTAYGGVNYYRFYPDETVTVQPVISFKNTLSDVLASVTAYWLNKTRNAEDVLREQNDNHSRNATVLRQMRDQAAEVRDLLSRKEISIAEFGGILHHGWEMKKGLASTISIDWIDELYAVALDAGAAGGKVAGAGGGGFLLIASEPGKEGAVDRAMRDRGFTGYKFQKDSLGTSVISLG